MSKYQVFRGDIVEVRDLSIKFAVDSDPHRITNIPKSAIRDGDTLDHTDEEDKVDIEIAQWFVDKHPGMFD